MQLFFSGRRKYFNILFTILNLVSKQMRGHDQTCFESQIFIKLSFYLNIVCDMGVIETYFEIILKMSLQLIILKKKYFIKMSKENCISQKYIHTYIMDNLQAIACPCVHICMLAQCAKCLHFSDSNGIDVYDARFQRTKVCDSEKLQ